MAQLRPAADVRAEVGAQVSALEQAAHDERLETVVAEIEKHKHKGTLTFMSLRGSVVDVLRGAGYKVTYHRAAGCGDVDSHTIEW